MAPLDACGTDGGGDAAGEGAGEGEDAVLGVFGDEGSESPFSTDSAMLISISFFSSMSAHVITGSSYLASTF